MKNRDVLCFVVRRDFYYTARALGVECKATDENMLEKYSNDV